jgi:hypothetical protein
MNRSTSESIRSISQIREIRIQTWFSDFSQSSSTEHSAARGKMKRSELIEGALTRSIIGGFYEVYNTLDFGFL